LKKPRVFILNKKPGYDYSSLLDYSDKLIAITEGQINFKDFHNMEMTIDACFEYEKFNPEHDFIALTSFLPLALVLGINLKGTFPGEDIKFLIFNAKTREYEIRNYII